MRIEEINQLKFNSFNSRAKRCAELAEIFLVSSLKRLGKDEDLPKIWQIEDAQSDFGRRQEQNEKNFVVLGYEEDSTCRVQRWQFFFVRVFQKRRNLGCVFSGVESQTVVLFPIVDMQVLSGIIIMLRGSKVSRHSSVSAIWGSLIPVLYSWILVVGENKLFGEQNEYVTSIKPSTGVYYSKYVLEFNNHKRIYI